MIISRTPFRMSFVGGGSDMPAYYKKHTGAVISTTIDKYVYVNVNQKFDSGIRIAYSKNEEVSSISLIEHRLVKAALELLEIPGGIEITTIADIPSKGTGLGSSSAFTVGLLNALRAFKNQFSSASALSVDSCRVEIDICKEPIGKQDQYAAAYGGFNLIEFRPDETVVVSPVICQPSTLRTFEESILLFYTGITRSASLLLERQSEDVSSSTSKQAIVKEMVSLAYHFRDAFQSNDLQNIGEILHNSWSLKKTITEGITTSEIDEWYQIARKAGVIGGKILGAGAGGFLMVMAPCEKHDAIKRALSFLRPIPIAFEPLGSRIIFYH